jgi:ethanolamine ammonia-lyase small subunit
MSEPVPPDPWLELRERTAARIALGRTGGSLPTREVLAFDLAHARARDAVHAALDADKLAAGLGDLGWTVLRVRSRAENRAAYLARPDWGRRLDADSAALLTAQAPSADVVFVLSDGLSAEAVKRHAPPLLAALKPSLDGLRLAPLLIATQARVALADEAGELLSARLAVSLIGERPGLSAADSLGAYLTYGPRMGRSDAERNCISNIRPAGLGYEAAAAQMAAQMRAALAQQLSGVALKLDPACAFPSPLGGGPA